MNHKSFFPYFYKGLQLIFIATLIAGLVFSVQPTRVAEAAGSVSAPQRTLTVEALIDGRSWLILHKNTLQWYHLDYAAPGRLEFQNVPTLVNGKEWFPVWPDVPDAENRDCYCYSSVLKGVQPFLHRNKLPVEINVLEGRGVVSFVEFPSASNDYTMVIQFDDNPYGGAVMYKIEFVYSATEKP